MLKMIRPKMLTGLMLALTALFILLPGCKGAPAPSPTPTSAAVKLVFTTQPAGAIAGSAIDPAPALAAVDAAGNVVTAFRGLVVLKIAAGSGVSEAHLFGGSSIPTTSGTVTFKNVSIDKAGAGYRLTATSGSLEAASSAPFTVAAGEPARLAFTVQPSGGVAGTPFNTQPEVIVQDRFGNPVSAYQGAVTLTITYGGGPISAIVSGKNSVPVSGNVARFSDISINRSYPEFTLSASSGTLEPGVSQRFAVTHATAARLEFTVPVSGAVAGKPFDEQPKVAVMDIYGNVVITAVVTINIDLTPGTGAAGAKLSGKKTFTTEGGMGGLAEFEDLAIDKAGTGYKLTATTSGLTDGTSQPFDVKS